MHKLGLSLGIRVQFLGVKQFCKVCSCFYIFASSIDSISLTVSKEEKIEAGRSRGLSFVIGYASDGISEHVLRIDAVLFSRFDQSVCNGSGAAIDSQGQLGPVPKCINLRHLTQN